MRGEYAEFLQLLIPGTGTPPLARGKLPEIPVCFFKLRNTPACAGKTQNRRDTDGPSKEHPRLRGENLKAPIGTLAVQGTPPLARGKHGPLLQTQQMVGNTPACAGKTWSPAPDSTNGWEHPRLRGENDQALNGSNVRSGTPPLARGNLAFPWAGMSMSRNTPACAGKTKNSLTNVGIKAEHPRLRGENEDSPIKVNIHQGTPPLARGKH